MVDFTDEELEFLVCCMMCSAELQETAPLRYPQEKQTELKNSINKKIFHYLWSK